jgi:hypothetical protein
MFENLDKYLPLYYKDEQGEFQELGTEQLDDIFGSVSPFSVFEELFNDFAPKEIELETTQVGVMKVQVVYLNKKKKYEIRVHISDMMYVPVWACDSDEEAMTSHDLYVSALRARSVKKLTNFYNGDIINIEMKNSGEEMNEAD